ncbi:hypothetical protein Anapl_17240 [Anas platyrhynchos]|uniref:Fibronectin type-III domain-containing protein n=1 Tax=Anas platyrhynchos TaxID=8839 RepID=R0KKQ2_ANAPL|nr:hypothetical protein Anapl_17240 [Anas platyrhynchos]
MALQLLALSFLLVLVPLLGTQEDTGPKTQGAPREPEAFQVVPGTLEAFTTSIKLNWTCSLPDACQRMQATCRLAGPSSPSCEAEEVTAQEILHGQNGTFTCDHLQPFTDYSVTITVPPSTVLFKWVIRTKETGVSVVQQIALASSAGPKFPPVLLRSALRSTRGAKVPGASLRKLPSCRHCWAVAGWELGTFPSSSVSCPQLNVTAWGPQDGGFLQVERLRLSSSVTEHPLPAHGPGTRYTVAVRGLTAAGAGAALLGTFQSNGSDTAAPPDASSRLVRGAPSPPPQGTAVLRLRPIPWVPGAARQCPNGLRAGRRDPRARLGFHNAPLRPGWDYTALLRLEQRSQEEETFTCMCYSFSMVAGQPPGSWTGIVIGVVVLILLLLLCAGIVWFVVSRRRKDVPIKAKDNN